MLFVEGGREAMRVLLFKTLTTVVLLGTWFWMANPTDPQGRPFPELTPEWLISVWAGWSVAYALITLMTLHKIFQFESIYGFKPGLKPGKLQSQQKVVSETLDALDLECDSAYAQYLEHEQDCKSAAATEQDRARLTALRKNYNKLNSRKTNAEFLALYFKLLKLEDQEQTPYVAKS